MFDRYDREYTAWGEESLDLDPREVAEECLAVEADSFDDDNDDEMPAFGSIDYTSFVCQRERGI
jgi:hypothetical protein